MRLLGPKASFGTFRWDLVYLYGSLNAEEDKPAVEALASGVLALVDKLNAARAAFEEAENLLVIAYALRARRDRQVDAKTVELGGVARATDKQTYAVLFPSLNPSQVTKLALDEQLKENHRIAQELGSLPTDHELRKQYESGLKVDIQELEAADAGVDKADVALALARSKVRQFKMQLDKERLAVNAQLLQLLGDKKAADSFFRPVTSTPGEPEPGDAGSNEPTEPKPA
jgi:hypothetical protein